jgi:predicted DNA-binding transcriptional regulator AlpA
MVFFIGPSQPAWTDQMDSIQSNITGKACYSVDEFCSAHAISRAMFYKLRADGKAPPTMAVGSRTLVSYEAAADWRRSCENIEAA